MFAHYSKWVQNYSDKIRRLLNSTTFPLPPEAISDFDQLRTEISKAVVSSIDDTEPFTVETDASDFAISAVLSQCGRPVAFFSQKLNDSERKHSAVEKEAYAVISALKKWRYYLLGRFFKIITDQRSVSFMFDMAHQNKIKKEKIQRWWLEMSCYNYEIIYRPGRQNQDIFSRTCNATQSDLLYSLHCVLCYPGVTRMVYWVRTRNLPYSVEDIKKMTASCPSCNTVKPQFYKNSKFTLVKAMHPFERISMDFKGPLPSKSRNKYLLTIVDEFSRFPFAYPCPNMNSSTVIDCLTSLFTTFGLPSYVHTDRGTSFTSKELQDFLHTRGVATSMSAPYNPIGNGQIERQNGIIWRTVSLALKHRKLDPSDWESVLPDALHSIRSLLCTATNETPHERMFRHNRRSANGTSLPTWLSPSNKALMKKHVRTTKCDPLVEIMEVNPQYARVRLDDAVTLKYLAPHGGTTMVPESEGTDTDEQHDTDPVLQPEENQQEGTPEIPTDTASFCKRAIYTCPFKRL
nr:uncharacterized protein LOC106692604 [Halyomorpha halys]